jgi:HSP20 family molecular chaperone IbpA
VLQVRRFLLASDVNGLGRVDPKTTREYQQFQRLQAAKEKEMQRLEKDFQEAYAKTKLNHEERLVDLTEGHKQEEMLRHVEHQETLGRSREQLKNELKTIEQQKTQLENFEQQKMQQARNDFNQSYQELYRDQSASQAALQEKLTAETNASQWDTTQKIAQVSTSNQQRMTDIQDRQERSLQNTELQFLDRMKRDETAHAVTLHQKMDEQATTLQEMDRKHEHLKNNQGQRYSKELASQTALYQQKLIDEKKAFEERVSFLKMNHDAHLKTLDEKFKGDYQNILATHEKSKMGINARETDSFYQLMKFDPIVEATPEHYTVKIIIPDYEKDNVLLNVDKRQLRLSFNRRFQEEREAADKSVSKTSRSEVLTKNFFVPDILTGVEMKKDYQNGVLTFTVKRA